VERVYRAVYSFNGCVLAKSELSVADRSLSYGKVDLARSPKARASPGLRLTDELKPIYDQLSAELTERVKKLTWWARAILLLIFFVILAAVTFIVLAWTILDKDIGRAQLNEELMAEYDRENTALTADIKAIGERVKAIHDDLLSQFAKIDYEWLENSTNQIGSTLYWAEISGQLGFAIGDNSTILYTFDGGKNWTSPAAPNIAPRAAFALGKSNKLLGWVAGEEGKIAKTSDGGQQWSIATVRPKKNQTVTGDFNYIWFKDEMHGWAAGNEGIIVSTSDGGNTWSVAKTPDGQGDLYTLKFMDDTNAIAVGKGMTILLSQDGGITWLDVKSRIPSIDSISGKDLLTLDESTDSRGIVLIGGQDGILLRGQIQQDTKYFTIDFSTVGANNSPNGITYSLPSVRAIDSFGTTDFMIAVGDRGLMLLSKDRGQSWTKIEAGDSALLYAKSISADTAEIAGDGGTIGELQIDQPADLIKNRPKWKPVHTRAKIFWMSTQGEKFRVAVGEKGLLLSNYAAGQARTILARMPSDQSLTSFGNENDPTWLLLNDEVPKNSLQHEFLVKARQELHEVNKQLTADTDAQDKLKDRKQELLGQARLGPTEVMLWLNGSRALVLVVAFFLVRFLVSLYRYHMRLAAYYAARKDTLMALRMVSGDFRDIVASMSPDSLDFTKVATDPLNQAADMAKELLRMKGKDSGTRED
jgi:photosystem II stability/assembly factor-like uncharacterized protein